MNPPTKRQQQAAIIAYTTALACIKACNPTDRKSKKKLELATHVLTEVAQMLCEDYEKQYGTASLKGLLGVK
jgi:hypothetical protein